jgi:hypothetical protein
MTRPPGNSVDLEQGSRVADPGDDLVSGLALLLERIRQELDYNDAKGDSPFRLGMHDGLRFAEDAIVDLLQRHGFEFQARATELDA